MNKILKPLLNFLVTVIVFQLTVINAIASDFNSDEDITKQNKALPLIECVYSSLLNHSSIKLQKETVKDFKGSLMSAKGAFDLALIMKLKGELVQKELTYSEWKTEDDERKKERMFWEIEGEVATNLQTNLDSEEGRIESFTIEEESEEHNMDLLLDFLIGTETNPGIIARLERMKNERIEDSRATVQKIIDGLRSESEGSRERLENMGSTPNIGEDIKVSLEAGIKAPFKNGASLTPSLKIEMSNHQFKNKPYEKIFGGTSEKGTYESTVGLIFNMPLGKGWGEDTVAASEKAAGFNYDAVKLILQHEISARIYNVAIAYWNVVAAQQKMSFLENSKKMQARIVELSKALVDSGIKAKADLNRILGNYARTQSRFLASQRTLNAYQIQLANAMGIKIDNINNVPSTIDDFPSVLNPEIFESIKPNTFIEKAENFRMDYRASLKSRDSSHTLLKAARLDLRNRIDLDFKVGYQGRHDSTSTLEGIEKSLFENLIGPSFEMNLSFNWPFGNNDAKGRLVQANSTWRKSVINVEELKR
ncbi:MAG: TolC family protein, partial [Desulfobacterales bacterium]|nr:TolC family protein [Desulfobacterales bacterium]